MSEEVGGKTLLSELCPKRIKDAVYGWADISDEELAHFKAFTARLVPELKGCRFQIVQHSAMQTVAIPDKDDGPMIQFSWRTNKVYRLDRKMWQTQVEDSDKYWLTG